MAEDRLIVFVKWPQPGEVKTRLAKAIGPDLAAALYRCFVVDTLAAATESGYPTLVFFQPSEARHAMSDWLGSGMILRSQKGKDLGERMVSAFRETFSESSCTVLIGSDSPDLSPALLKEAFAALKSHQAVVGPAVDGGYYLIGFSSDGFNEAVFNGIEWGAEGVFEATMMALKATGIKYSVLPTWNDIDEYDDLKVFYDRHRTLPRGRLWTMDFLRDHFHW